MHVGGVFIFEAEPLRRPDGGLDIDAIERELAHVDRAIDLPLSIDVFGLTATVDILRDMAAGSGPRRSMLALGYAGWGPGQLDSEIQANGWLHAEADEALIFDPDLEGKWEQAIAKLGFDMTMLSGDAGHA